jgi:hypothetical protein
VWLGLAYMLILIIPTSCIALLKFSEVNHITSDRTINWRHLLFGFQGVALAFWTFDMITTFYAIDVAGLAIELNPLGWPTGILGAFAFYGPTVTLSYVLLFRLKEHMALQAAIPFTLVTLAMSSMNLFAGAQNFQVFVDTAALGSNVRLELLVALATFNLAIPVTIKHMANQAKIRLNLV